MSTFANGLPSPQDASTTKAHIGQSDADREIEDARSPHASNAARRFLKDTLRESDVIVVLIGETSFAFDPSLQIVQVNVPRDLLRVAGNLMERKVCVAQVTAETYMLLEQLAGVVHARLYLLVDVPDLTQTPQEKMLVSALQHRVTLSDVETVLKNPIDRSVMKDFSHDSLDDAAYEE